MDFEQKDNLLDAVSVAAKNGGHGTFIKDLPLMGEGAAKGLAEKYGVDFVRLSEVSLSPQVVHLLPQWFVARHNVISVSLEDDVLYVAMSNPAALPVLDEINLMTGFEVRAVVATEKDILQAVSEQYGAEQLTKQDMVDVRLDTEFQHEDDSADESLDLSEGDGQVVRLVNAVIKDAIDSGASDIHFESHKEQMIIRFRVDGILHDCMTVPSAIKQEVISRLKILSKLDITEKRKAQDGHITIRHEGNSFDLRVSVMPTVDGEKIVLRVLNKNKAIINLDRLGFSADEISSLEQVSNRAGGP